MTEPSAETSLDAAFSLLPWWVRFGNVLVALAFAVLWGLVVSAIVGWLTRIPTRHLPQDASWYERARAEFPGRIGLFRAAWVAALIVPVSSIAVGMHGLIAAGPVHAIPASVVLSLSSVATFAVIYRAYSKNEARVTQTPHSGANVARDLASRIVIHHLPIGFVVGTWLLVQTQSTPSAAITVAVATLMYLAVVFGAGLSLARWLGLASPASPRLAAIVEAVASRVTSRPSTWAGSQTRIFPLRPRVLEIALTQANAVAFPAAATVVFTAGALAVLTDEELGSVAAHELGHLTEARRVSLLRVSGGLLLLFGAVGERALAAALRSQGPIAIAVAIATALAPCFLALWFIVRPLARRMEWRADQVARDLVFDGRVFAEALERIYQANMVPPVVGRKRMPHPELYDRMIAAGVSPGYARPMPPNLRLAQLGVMATVVLGCSITAVGTWIHETVRRHPGRDGPIERDRASLAMTGETWDLGELARQESEEGHFEEAIVFYQACEILAPDSVYYPANKAIVLTYVGRCDEARIALGDARERLDEDESPDATESVVLWAAERAMSQCHLDKRSPSEQLP